MTVRVVEGKKPYTGGKAIDIDENKVISLRLRDENNLIIWDEGDNEIYVDLQLDDEIRPTDAFPVGVTTGRVIVDNGWDATGTIICAKTTSGDNIKLFYADNGKLYIDNGTGTFKQIYFKGDVDAIASALQNQINTIMGLGKFLSIWNCATGLPTTFPLDLPYEYTTGDWYLVGVVDNTTNYKPSGSQFTGIASTTVETNAPMVNDVYIYDGTTWMRQVNSGVGGGVTFAQIIGQPTDNQNLATALGNKQDSLTLPATPTQGNLVTWGADNETLVDGGTVPTGVPSGGTDGQVLSKVSGSVAWANPTGGAEIEYKTQAEYNALLPGAASDGKHYFIYTPSVVPPTPGTRPTITGFSYDNKTLSYTRQVNAITFNKDGTKMFLAGEGDNTVYQYSLSTPRDISTAAYDNKSKSVSSQSNVTESIIFKDDGLTMFIGGRWSTGYLYKYTLSTAWDISTANYDNVSSSQSFYETTSYHIYDGGMTLLTCSRGNKKAYKYTLGTAWDITTIQSNPQELALGSFGYHEAILNPQGTQMFILDRSERKVLIYNLSTAQDITTATLSNNYTFTNPDTATALGISGEGSKMYLGGTGSYIYQYSTVS